MAVGTFFDGTNDEIVLGTADPTMSTTFSVAGMVYINSAAVTRDCIAMMVGAQPVVRVTFDSTNISIDSQGGTPPWFGAFSTPNWYFFCITKAAGTVVPKLYLTSDGSTWSKDGAAADAGTLDNIPSTAIDDFRIGSTLSSNFWNGEIAALLITNTELNAATAKGLIDYSTWSGLSGVQFNTGTSMASGGTVNDTSSINNDEASRVGATKGNQTIPVWFSNFVGDTSTAPIWAVGPGAVGKLAWRWQQPAGRDDAQVSQAAYRWYADGTETGAAALAAQDTSYAADISGGDVNLLLRTRLQLSNTVPTIATDDWKLQWEKNGDGTWTDVVAALTLVDSYATSNADSFSPSGHTGGATIVVQSFLGNGQKLKQAGFLLYGLGTISGNVSGVLYAHSGTFGTGGVGTGSALTTSTNAIDVTTITTDGFTTTFTTFDFDNTYTMVNGTAYCIGYTASGIGADASNTLRVRTDGSASTHAGNPSSFIASWASGTADRIFEVYSGPTAPSGTTVVPFNSTNLTDGAVTTEQLTGGIGSFVAGYISEDGTADNLGWSAGYTELLYAVTLVAADLADSDTLRFRVARNGVPLLAYDQTPTVAVTTGAAGTNVTVGSAAVAVTAQAGTEDVAHDVDDATVTATGNQVTVSRRVDVGSAAVTVTAGNVGHLSALGVGTAAVTVTANLPGNDIRPNVGSAPVIVAGNNATVSTSSTVNVTVGSAAVTVTANQPSHSIAIELTNSLVDGMAFVAVMTGDEFGGEHTSSAVAHAVGSAPVTVTGNQATITTSSSVTVTVGSAAVTATANQSSAAVAPNVGNAPVLTVGNDVTVSTSTAVNVAVGVAAIDVTGYSFEDVRAMVLAHASLSASDDPSVTFSSYTPLENDVIVFFIASTTAIAIQADASLPAGWVNPLGDGVEVSQTANGMACIYHLVTAAEESAVTLTYTATNALSSAITGYVHGIAVRNVDPANVVDGSGTSLGDASSALHVLPGITGSGVLLDRSLVLSSVAKDGTGLYSVIPSGWTRMQSTNTFAAQWTGYKAGYTDANTDVAATDIYPQATDEYVSISVALANAPSAVGTNVTVGSAAVTVTANNVTAAPSPSAGNAAVTATANQTGISNAHDVGNALVTVVGNNVSVSTSSSVNVSVGVAAVTVAANDVSHQIAGTVGTAAATVTGNVVAGSVAPSPGPATVTATANNLSSSVKPNTAFAAVTVTANNVGISNAHDVNLATVLVVGNNATVSTSSSINVSVGSAAVTVTGNDSSAAVAHAVGVATVTVTGNNATISTDTSKQVTVGTAAVTVASQTTGANAAHAVGVAAVTALALTPGRELTVTAGVATSGVTANQAKAAVGAAVAYALVLVTANNVVSDSGQGVATLIGLIRSSRPGLTQTSRMTMHHSVRPELEESARSLPHRSERPEVT